MRKFLSKIPKPKLGSVLNPAVELGETLFSGVSGAFDKVTGTFDTGVGLLQTSLGGIPFFGATATSNTYGDASYDEKHYFLIPDNVSEEGYSLYVMRCLPAGVPPINDLEKRRLLHLPVLSALPMLEHVVVEDARERASETAESNNFLTNNLENLIDEIDRIDKKMFGGVLLLGGLVALANPLAGAAVAMNAALPPVAMILSKYGLKFASETATNLDVAQQIKRAEKDILKQFNSAETLVLVNPILQHLAKPISLDMWIMESEKFQYICTECAFSQEDILRLTDLTRQAISDVVTEGETQSYLDKVVEIICAAQSS